MAESNQQFHAGQARGHAQAKTGEWVQSAKDTTNKACDNIANATNSTQQSCQQGKEQTAGILQQTGEQMKNMAQGAVDTVNSTLGMGDKL